MQDAVRHRAARPRRPAAPARRAFAQGRAALALGVVAAAVTGASVPVAAPLAQAPAAPAPAQVATAAPVVVAAAQPGVAAEATALPAAAPDAPVAEAPVAAPQSQLLQVAMRLPRQNLGRDTYFAHLRSELRWVPVRVGDREVFTPDAASRLLLAQSAAARAGLGEVGLDFRDVYGLINAETSWVPRPGLGRNGVVSAGLAQFEPATARAVGLRNPNDPVAAVHAAAVLLKEAAQWSARRIAALHLGPDAYAAKLREGISVYYNLSSRARQAWSGRNARQLPVETQRHIRNVRAGVQQAERLQAGASLDLAAIASVAAASASPATAPQAKAARPAHAVRVAASPARTTGAAHPVVVAQRDGRKTWVLPQGTIGWSHAGS
jgi:hypothetical protein